MARRVGRKRVAELLFPELPPPVVAPRTVLLVFAALVAGTIVGLLRQTGGGALDTLYAEDGQIFLAEALRRSTLGALTSSYMGYFHLFPRLLAELATAVPLSKAAAILAVASSAAVAALALVVYRASTPHIPTPPVRAVLASAMVLLPVAQEEVFNNAANIHWFMIFAAAWVLLWNPRARWELAVGAVVLVVAGLSDPLTALLAPLALCRLVTLRTWRSHVLTGAFAIGVGGQLLAIAVSGAERTGLSPSVNVVKAAGQYVAYVVGRGTFGMRLLGDPEGGRETLIAMVALVLVGAVAAAFVVRFGALPSPVALVLLAGSGIYYLATVLLTGISPPRYTVIPILLLFSAVACLIGRLLADEAGGVARATAVVVGFVVAVTWTTNYRVDNRRSTGRQWDVELTRARGTCDGSSGRSVRVPISPPGWYVDVPCREMVAAENGDARG